MAATNWTIIKRNKKNNALVLCNLGSKWTYKTALGIAFETNNYEEYEVICVIEKSKILSNYDKETEKTE